VRRAGAALLVVLGCGAPPGVLGKADSGAGAGPGRDSAAVDCPADVCFGDCTDVRSDPENCGGCGITCVVPFAAAACVDGVCTVGECEDGAGDCDGDPSNGCESVATCVPGAACTTVCGSTGALSCSDPCAPFCAPPGETCSAADDDCDGACDEGALPGCRQSAYRSSGPLGHVYGVDPAEAAALGQNLESSPYFYTHAAEAPGLTPLYRCDKGGGRRFLTVSSSCEIGLPIDLVVGWVSTTERCGAVPLYRLYSAAASNHFYTLSAEERDNAVAVYGYVSEGVAAWVWTGP
jgi:hypothetical protein